MDKIIDGEHIILITIEMNIEQIILEMHKIIEVRILEVDTEETKEMISLEEVGGGLGIDNIQIISEGMTKVVVGLDQVQEPVQIGLELHAKNGGGDMIISLRNVQFHRYKKNQSRYDRCIIWTKNKQH